MVGAQSVLAISGRVIFGLILLTSAELAAAQSGGHGISIGGGVYTAPNGVDEKDSLKDFHQALAVQATSQQITNFQQLVKNASAAHDQLAAFASAKSPRDGIAALDQSLESARVATKKFQDGLSEEQKSGLRETLRRLDKADSDLAQEAKRFDQTVESETAAAGTAPNAANLDTALASFSNAQLALGREMGITLASAQDVSFNLPAVKNPVNLGGRTISVAASGVLAQTVAQGDLRTFRLDSTLDLTDLQQNITTIMNALLREGSACGERLGLRSANILPAPPASLLVLQLHFERWLCAGQSSPTELAESDGSVEVKVTPSVQNSALQMAAEFSRIDATGMMADDLRSGDLGDDLRDKVSKSMLLAVQAGGDFKTTLPQSLQNAATLDSAKFQDGGAGILRMLLTGQVRISNEQATELANQLNQALSARAAQSVQPEPPATSPAR
ncbi:MAG: hypothetical protein WCF26_20765 [Candidatus Sulfotelmatobacter sp.]